MSPLWRDQLRVVLTPRQVVVLRLRAGVRRRVSSQHVIDCDPAQAGEASWHNALAVLQTALTEMGKNKADVFVMLSNHFVRYALIPRSNDMVTEDIDISWKLQLKFWDIRYEPRALCWILMPETIPGLWRSCVYEQNRQNPDR